MVISGGGSRSISAVPASRPRPLQRSGGCGERTKSDLSFLPLPRILTLSHSNLPASRPLSSTLCHVYPLIAKARAMGSTREKRSRTRRSQLVPGFLSRPAPTKQRPARSVQIPSQNLVLETDTDSAAAPRRRRPIAHRRKGQGRLGRGPYQGRFPFACALCISYPLPGCA